MVNLVGGKPGLPEMIFINRIVCNSQVEDETPFQKTALYINGLNSDIITVTTKHGKRLKKKSVLTGLKWAEECKKINTDIWDLAQAAMQNIGF